MKWNGAGVKTHPRRFLYEKNSVLRRSVRTVDLEKAVEHGDLQDAEHLLVDMQQPHCSAVFFHLAFGNQERAQAAAVAEFYFSKVNDERLEFRGTEKDKLTLELSGNGGVELFLLERELGGGGVFLDFEFHVESPRTSPDIAQTARSVGFGFPRERSGSGSCKRDLHGHRQSQHECVR
jgi:hypothetical protein